MMKRSVFLVISTAVCVLSFLFLCTMLVFVTVVQPDSTPWSLPGALGVLLVSAGAMIWKGTGRLVWIPFLLTGVVISSLSMLYGFGGAAVQFAVVNIVVPVCVLSLFITVGICFIAVPRAVYRRKSEIYTLAVQAVVCGKREARWTDEDCMVQVSYRLDWRYHIGCEERVYRSDSGRRPETRDIGDSGVLYVNPRDYDDVWEKPDKALQRWADIAGALFMTVGAAGLVYLLSSAFLPVF